MYNYNPYYQPQFQQMQRFQQVEQQYPQFNQQQQMQQQFRQQIGLQGKSVDSIDVVKAMDIPLDGSVSYFPLTDGTAIVSKQLQMDGTAKTIIYKPIEDEKTKKSVILPEDLTKEIEGIKKGNNILKDNISQIKSEIIDLSINVNKMIEQLKENKGGKK